MNWCRKLATFINCEKVLVFHIMQTDSELNKYNEIERKRFIVDNAD